MLCQSTRRTKRSGTWTIRQLQDAFEDAWQETERFADQLPAVQDQLVRLQGRIEGVRRQGGLFAGVELSPMAQSLLNDRNATISEATL